MSAPPADLQSAANCSPLVAKQNQKRKPPMNQNTQSPATPPEQACDTDLLVSELRRLSAPTADREDADWLMGDAADRIEMLEERCRKCATMDEAQKMALIRAMQEIGYAVGAIGNELSPREIVERVKLQCREHAAVDKPSARRCEWFPDVECDEICAHIGCGAQGLLINMRSEGVPQSEVGGSLNFIPQNSKE